MRLLADTPALPLHEAGKYVAGAYVVLFALVLIYVAIMSIRLSRIDGELSQLLSATTEAGEQPAGGTPHGGALHGDTPRGGTDADGRTAAAGQAEPGGQRE